MQASELPGPRGRLLNTYRALGRPFESVLAWRARFGDPFLLRAFNGDIVMTGRADLVKAIFGANPDAFAPFGVKAVAPVVGEQSLLILGGEAHRQQRKLLMPPFHGARMRAYAETMREVTVRRLEAAAGSSADASLQDLAQQITLEIIVRAIFGVEEGAEVEAIADGIVATVDAVHPAFLFMPWLQRELGGFGPYARFRRAFERGDRELQELIEARRRRPAGDDILWMLLEARHDDGAPMSDAHLRDELRTLIVAGHETTAMTIAFLVDNLYRSPHALARARDEAVQVEGSAASALATLPYLDAVAKETLRLRPIVTEVMRTLRVPMTLGDVEAPAGMHLGVSMALAHFDPEVYPDPQAFRPERFLERQFTPAEYLPFGGGSRRCIGAAFADMEIRIAMATLLASFDVTLRSPEPAVPVRRNITMGPAGGVPVRLARRRPRAACAPGPRPADAGAS